MDDTTESQAQEGRWLLLVAQLPSGPDYLRVKLRRRLQKVGAVPVRSSVYLLPATEECTEDFAWLRRQLVGDGGDALIAAVSFVGGLTDGEAESQFRADRDFRYQEVAEMARAELERLGATATRGEVESVKRRLERRLEEVIAMDFFDAPGRSAAEHAVRRIAQLIPGEASVSGISAVWEKPRVAGGSRWVTRRGVRVDRMASAWLIRRFIDPDAEFSFVAPESGVAQEGVYRFDMYEGEFTHEGERCTFETLVNRFGLEEASPALRAVGEVVHDIDCKDGKYGRAEVAGLAAMIEGVTARESSDERRLEEGFRIFDDLHAWFGRRAG